MAHGTVLVDFGHGRGVRDGAQEVKKPITNHQKSPTRYVSRYVCSLAGLRRVWHPKAEIFRSHAGFSFFLAIPCIPSHPKMGRFCTTLSERDSDPTGEREIATGLWA